MGSYPFRASSLSTCRTRARNFGARPSNDRITGTSAGTIPNTLMLCRASPTSTQAGRLPPNLGRCFIEQQPENDAAFCDDLARDGEATPKTVDTDGMQLFRIERYGYAVGAGCRRSRSRFGAPQRRRRRSNGSHHTEEAWNLEVAQSRHVDGHRVAAPHLVHVGLVDEDDGAPRSGVAHFQDLLAETHVGTGQSFHLLREDDAGRRRANGNALEAGARGCDVCLKLAQAGLLRPEGAPRAFPPL